MNGDSKGMEDSVDLIEVTSSAGNILVDEQPPDLDPDSQTRGAQAKVNESTFTDSVDADDLFHEAYPFPPPEAGIWESVPPPEERGETTDNSGGKHSAG